MTIPLRVFAYLDDEEFNSWWVTITNARTFERVDGDRIVVTPDRLTLVANGNNDVLLSTNWPRHKQARFQPHRELDGT